MKNVPMVPISTHEASRFPLHSNRTGEASQLFSGWGTTFSCPKCGRGLLTDGAERTASEVAQGACLCLCGEWLRMPDAALQLLSSSSRSPEVPVLYRYFPTEEWRADFIAGNVYLSTFEKCRTTEDKARNDTEEGFEYYRGNLAIGSSGPSDADRAIANRIGFTVGEGSRDIVVHNHVSQSQTNDMFLLCLSSKLSARLMHKFGQWAVRIENVASVFATLTQALSSQGKVEVGLLRSVLYRDRSTRGNETIAVPFVKPNSFSEEHEVRMLWHPSHFPIVPGPISVRWSDPDITPVNTADS